MATLRANRDGFVVPVVIFTMVMLGLMAVTALTTANDEQRSSRAMRESGAALYAAEAGGSLLIATVVDPPRTVLDTLATNLAAGDSVDLGWTSLPGDASYRGVLHRYDNGGQAMYVLSVEGRRAGAWGGRGVIDFFLTKAALQSFVTASIRGGSGGNGAQIEDPPGVSGIDTNPAAWGAACTGPLEDQPGLVWGNTNVDSDPGTLLGDPPLEVDPTIDATNLFEFGGFDYDDLAAAANIIVSDDPGLIQPVVTGGVCDTSLEYNWGAPESGVGHPCYDYFPIIHHTGGELRIRNATSVGQGILLVDGDLRIEDNFRFYGIIIVKGSVRFEDNGTQITGGIISAEIDRVRDGAGVQYSSCVLGRVLSAVSVPALFQLEALSSRSWSAPLR